MSLNDVVAQLIHLPPALVSAQLINQPHFVLEVVHRSTDFVFWRRLLPAQLDHQWLAELMVFNIPCVGIADPNHVLHGAGGLFCIEVLAHMLNIIVRQPNDPLLLLALGRVLVHFNAHAIPADGLKLLESYELDRLVFQSFFSDLLPHDVKIISRAVRINRFAW